VRTERIVTNLRCNQRCLYCTARRAEDDLAAIQPARVRAAIDAAVGAGARAIVLTGGEPMMRGDLPALVAHARAGGAEEVLLETNATLADGPRAAALAAAGLRRARVNLAGWGEALDGVTRDPGGFAATLAGLRALAGAGIAVEVQAALVRSTIGGAPALPLRLAEHAPGLVKGLIVVVPTASPDPEELLPYPEAARAIAALDDAARRVGIPAKLAADSGPPPCVFPPEARVSHLYALTPGAPPRAGHRHLPACDGCLVADRCPGLPEEYLARREPPPMTPVREDRLRRRLSLISTVEEQVRRELVTPNRYTSAEHGLVAEDLIRVNFHCNQTCRFCFVSTHLPPPPDEDVRAAILAAAQGGRRVTLTGGEPTLNPRLAEYVRLAKRHSRYPVNLQTNAVRLDDRALAEALAAAGVDEAFVSLHGATAEVSDAITGAPGTFARTLVGLDHLHALGVRVILNFVICERNLGELAPWVRLAGARWPRAWLNLSFVAPSTDVVPRDRDLIPRYADALPAIAEAIAEAERLGLELGGFESMCGVPLCLVPASVDRYFALAEVPPGFDRGEFLKPEPCRACALETRCYGVRRGYVELHGFAELRPVAR
jgi:MoaA/NifB/PqqE/SkfB family radical SAM enzyme